MAVALVALNSAREYLNDSAGTLWTNDVLMPKLREAHRQMQVRLQLAGIPVIKGHTTALRIPASPFTIDVTSLPGCPGNIIEPRWMKERPYGATRESDYVDMTQCDYLPAWDAQVELIWWCWRLERLLVPGVTQDREVQIRYTQSIQTPATEFDLLGFLYAENFLGPKTAALAASATENQTAVQEWTAEAERAMSDVIRMNIRGLQNLPARKRPYHRGRGRTRALRDF